jgi:hypothetical protein
MNKLKKYNDFLIVEKYDKNIKAQLIKMGVTDKEELKKQITLSKQGHLATYLHSKGENFTFGILRAIFKDAVDAKKKTTLKKNIFNILPIAIPLSLAPFFPVLAIVGTIFGSSRLVHRVFDTLFEYLEPQSKYTDFLKKTIDTYMMLPEGEVPLKDRFSRAFVVSDRLIDALKPEVVNDFTVFISNKMEKEDDNKLVPDHYIENELKKYLNDSFDINPEIPLKEIK